MSWPVLLSKVLPAFGNRLRARHACLRPSLYRPGVYQPTTRHATSCTPNWMPILFRLVGHAAKVVCTLCANISRLKAAFMGYELNVPSSYPMLIVPEYVYVSEDSLCTGPASDVNQHGQTQLPRMSTTPSDLQYDNGIPSTFNPSRGFTIEDNHRSPMDEFVAENMACTVLEQITTLIAGSRQQNELIMSQHETILQLTHQIDQQDNTITSLQGQIRDHGDEIAQLRSFVLAICQINLPLNRPRSSGASIEIDFSSSAEFSMPILTTVH